MQLKQKIYDHYLQVLDEKIASLQKVLADLKESGSNETKSTAGDKHETALAMLQIEQANVRKQLQELLEQKAVIQKINPALTTVSVVIGSLVNTSKGYLFISVALGKALIDGNAVIALSPKSPLGKKLMGLKMGDVAEISNSRYVIESIA
jgi:transcription elongation GreA/GreB family factor